METVGETGWLQLSQSDASVLKPLVPEPLLMTMLPLLPEHEVRLLLKSFRLCYYVEMELKQILFDVGWWSTDCLFSKVSRG
jgi:hypothetical protein